MNRMILTIIPLVAMLLAVFLGIYAQDIAYYFEDHFFYATPFKTLIIVTVASSLLFILAIVIEIVLLSKRKIKPRQFIVLLIITAFTGFFVSLWSLFVLVMWWD